MEPNPNSYSGKNWHLGVKRKHKRKRIREKSKFAPKRGQSQPAVSGGGQRSQGPWKQLELFLLVLGEGDVGAGRLGAGHRGRTLSPEWHGAGAAGMRLGRVCVNLGHRFLQGHLLRSCPSRCHAHKHATPPPVFVGPTGRAPWPCLPRGRSTLTPSPGSCPWPLRARAPCRSSAGPFFSRPPACDALPSPLKWAGTASPLRWPVAVPRRPHPGRHLLLFSFSLSLFVCLFFNVAISHNNPDH